MRITGCDWIAGRITPEEAGLCARELRKRATICRIEDGLVAALRLAIGLAENDHRVDDRAKLPPALGTGRKRPRISGWRMTRENGLSKNWAGAAAVE